MPVKAAPLFNWTGWYLGVNGGYSWGRSRTTVTDGGVPISSSIKHDGGLASGEGGYCWQSPTSNTVTCFEARYDFPREKGRGSFPVGGTTVNTLPEIDPLLIGPHFRFLTDANHQQWYVAGGLALGQIGGTATTGDGDSADAGSKWKTGWFVGVGTERMIDQHWSWKLEYDYVRIGGSTGATTTIAGRRGVLSGDPISIGGKAYDNVITVGLNYHFGNH